MREAQAHDFPDHHDCDEHSGHHSPVEALQS
jgi:hypothetical protein